MNHNYGIAYFGNKVINAKVLMKQSLMNFIFHPFDILMRVILTIHSIYITDSFADP